MVAESYPATTWFAPLIDAFVGAFVELAPWLLLGALAAGLLAHFVPREWLVEQTTGRWGVLKAVLIGVPMPLCSCAVIPSGMGLRQHGASRGATLGFLVSTPQTGVDSVLVTATFLGWPFALFKMFAALVMGLVAGIWGSIEPDDDDGDASDPAGNRSAVSRADNQANVSVGGAGAVSAVVAHSLDLLRSLWGWIMVGLVASALISGLMPQMSAAQLGAWGTWGGIAAVLVVALPLYVCATASVPIAASLVVAGLPMGGALVFLMAGPASNLATIAAVFRSLGTRSLIVYLTTIVAGSLGFAWLFELMLPGAGQRLTSVSTLHEHGQPWWAIASAGVLALLLLWFAASDSSVLIRRWRSTWARRGPAMLSLEVRGMTCGGCARTVEAALSGLPRVHAWDVDHKANRVSLWGDAGEDEVVRCIEASGYTVIRP